MTGGFTVTGYQAPGDLYLEWHAVDGGISQSGFGDDMLVDEDEDGCYETLDIIETCNCENEGGLNSGDDCEE